MTNYSAVRCPGCSTIFGKEKKSGIPQHIIDSGYDAIRYYMDKNDVKWDWVDCSRCKGIGFIAIDVDKLNKE